MHTHREGEKKKRQQRQINTYAMYLNEEEKKTTRMKSIVFVYV